MDFRLRSHPADVAVEAEGTTFGDAAAAAANGMAAAMCERVPAGGERVRVEVTAESRSALLFEYLTELILQRDIRGVLPVDNTATVSSTDTGYRLEGDTRGVPLDRVNARDLKAVTYSEMSIEETNDGWRVYVVFDV